MWHYLFRVLIVLLLAPLALIILKIVNNKIGLKHYEKQGLKTIFEPLMGLFALHSLKHRENQKKSNLEYINKLIDEDPQAGGFVVNSTFDGGVTLILTNPEYIKDFVAKEDLFMKLTYEKTTACLGGLLLANGAEAMKMRTIFNEIFHYPLIAELAPEICKLTVEILEGLNKKYGVNADTFTKINMDEIYNPIFEKVLYIIIFGCTDPPKLSSGKSVYDSIIGWFLKVPSLRVHPVYNLLPWVCQNFNILAVQREIWQANSEMLELVTKLYKEREAKGKLTNCVLDNCIKFNQKCKENGNTADIMTMQDIVGNVNSFVLAGTDTSQNMTKITLTHIAQNPYFQKLFEEINQRVYGNGIITTSSKLENDAVLQLWLKEALRIHNPNGKTFPRIAVKDVTIKDIKVRKGDVVVVPTVNVKYISNYFKDPETFNMDRFKEKMDKDIERYAYNPFWQGKRQCIGKNLGELMVMIMVTQFTNMYDMRKPEDVEYYRQMVVLVMQKYPFIDVKLKKRKVD